MTAHEASFIIGELLAALVIVGVMFFVLVRAFRKLHARLDGFDKIDTGFDRFEGSVDRFGERVGSKLDGRLVRFEESVDRFDEHVGSKLDASFDRFEESIDRFDGHVGSKLDDLTARIDALTATIEGGHSNMPPKRSKRPTFRIVRGGKR